MKITQEILDNGKKIVHMNYTKAEIEEMKRKHDEMMKKMEEDHKDAEATNISQEEAN